MIDGHASTTSSPDARSRRRRALASSVIVLFLALQAIAGFKLLCPPKRFEALAPLRICCSPMLWPFTDYQMYNGAYGPGVEIPRYRVVGVTVDGAEVPIGAEELGVAHTAWRRGLVDAMLYTRLPAIQEILSGFVRRTGHALARVRLEDHPIRTRENGGIEDAPEKTLFTFLVQRDGTLIVRRGDSR